MSPAAAPRYRILFAASEAWPLIKTGGLADVAGALPVALKARHHDIRLLLPAYPQARATLEKPRPAGHFTLGGYAVELVRGRLPGTPVPVWLVGCPALFERPGNPYLGPDGLPWPDNAQRFALFDRVIAHLVGTASPWRWQADMLHLHDWQTGLVPALLHGQTTRPACVFTIHNLAYQGRFGYSTFATLGLAEDLWTHEGLEFHGDMAFIKGGLAFADRLNTVSPGYAREIMTPDFGYGLDGLLRHRKARLSGILNGIDTRAWNPAHDPHIASPYNARRLGDKTANKTALQRALGLKVDADALLAGNVGRMVEQKGIDLLCETLPAMMERGIQLVVLGSGEARFEERLQYLARQYPGQVAVRIGYNEALAHRIEAGSDLFLMPSRFEPCGLNQLYSLRYGTLPLVHRVGGLADTVIEKGDKATDNGFVFDAPHGEALLAALDRALALWAKPTAWRRRQRNAMRADHSWRHSAMEYETLYARALADRQAEQSAMELARRGKTVLAPQTV
ncbi:MAG TPA: glycogen synthase GlgA [Gammaproteobacteria bacterium]|nr:glycogen synthase GlgA [Gammaproteobacteria bacterium]